MSNLIPEVRVDKNGIPVVRHVRSDKPITTGRSIPAPLAPRAPKQAVKVKAPIKRQLERRLRIISVNRHEPDNGLIARLGVDTSARFTASDAEIYSVLHVVSPANTLILMKAGVRSAEEAFQKLDELGLERLMEDNSVLARELLGRRVYPETYFSTLATYGDESPYFLDTVECLSIDALFDYDFIASGIRTGNIRLSDVKALGTARIKKSEAYAELMNILQKFANGTAQYSMSDVKLIFDLYSPHPVTISEALKLNETYGSGFGTDIAPTSFTMRLFRQLQHMNLHPQHSADVLKYGISLEEAYIEGSQHIMPTPEAMIAFHDAGVSVEDALRGLTPQQIDAMNNHEIAPSVSGGWL